MGKILNGRKLATELNTKLKHEVESLKKKYNVNPKLATILVGGDPASKIYVNIKHKTCEKIGIESLQINLKEDVAISELKEEIENLNADKSVHGILLQLPLPNELKENTDLFLNLIRPEKDVDGFHMINKGKLFNYDEELAACTPKGIITLLEEYNIDLEGKEVVIVSRSNLVGKPLIFMCLKRNATITVCHTSTIEIESHMKRADILIVAVGKANFVTKEKIKESAVIIDVGTNRIDGTLVGDVNFKDVLPKCAKITPVPGGVGPMTVHSLMRNTLNAFKKQLEST
ncbi:MAG: bifunctional 5,10-methylene-tetrahydrofolate dehydrogenase/5,10-methylene-tetrahydrofolate cyclohydrolase [Candidatus Lokiarchaeota archaeon]|nr:bifunctional 5,10-methylene-tetrahydrofolate dehydrogenase/5,10-methylene-tetrahydrofolate cyclohydrolase [Candidatus Lokiarchaeota archaeon]